MRIIAMLLTLSACVSTVHAQGPQTTTELGITITPEQVATAIEETQEFWGPVKKHLVSEQFTQADMQARQQTVQFLSCVHGSLHDRLFESDEAAANDLMEYLAFRLRKFELYRQLRTTLNDDAAMVALMDRWEKVFRDISALPEAERPGRLAALLTLMPEEMAAAGATPATTPTAMKIWQLQATCVTRMNATETGTMMLGFERDARKADKATSDLIRAVVTAADWALITKKAGEPYDQARFVSAWTELNELRAKRRLAALRPAATSK